jgi:hypothetical protein
VSLFTILLKVTLCGFYWLRRAYFLNFNWFFRTCYFIILLLLLSFLLLHSKWHVVGFTNFGAHISRAYWENFPNETLILPTLVLLPISGKLTREIYLPVALKRLSTMLIYLRIRISWGRPFGIFKIVTRFRKTSQVFVFMPFNLSQMFASVSKQRTSVEIIEIV